MIYLTEEQPRYLVLGSNDPVNPEITTSETVPMPFKVVERSDIRENYGVEPLDPDAEKLPAQDGMEWTLELAFERSGWVHVDLDFETGNPNLFLFAGPRETLEAAQVLVWGASEIWFRPDPGALYTVVVDSTKEEVGDFELRTKLHPMDSVQGAAAAPGPVIFGKNAGAYQILGSTRSTQPVALDLEEQPLNFVSRGDALLSYGGMGLPVYTGSEWAFEAQFEERTAVRVFLEKESAETDILVLKGSWADISTAELVGWDRNGVVFISEPGELYSFVVDGFLGSEGDFVFTVEPLNYAPYTPIEVVACDRYQSMYWPGLYRFEHFNDAIYAEVFALYRLYPEEMVWMPSPGEIPDTSRKEFTEDGQLMLDVSQDNIWYFMVRTPMDLMIRCYDESMLDPGSGE